MRFLVLSDVHADAFALEHVLDHAEGEWDAMVLLGDLIGYGEEPLATIRRLRDSAPVARVRGNHEAMLEDLVEGRRPRASRNVVDVLQRHREALDPDDLAWVLEPPERALYPIDSMRSLDLVHGSPVPGRPFEYLLGVPAARRALPNLQADMLLFGHSHVPGGFVEADGAVRPVPARGAETRVDLGRGSRWMLNPGSVARPRDRGPAGCYLLLDTDQETAILRRVDADR